MVVAVASFAVSLVALAESVDEQDTFVVCHPSRPLPCIIVMTRPYKLHIEVWKANPVGQLVDWVYTRRDNMGALPWATHLDPMSLVSPAREQPPLLVELDVSLSWTTIVSLAACLVLAARGITTTQRRRRLWREPRLTLGADKGTR